MSNGEGKITESESGKFMHTGGWLFVHDNNSVEVNEKITSDVFESISAAIFFDSNIDFLHRFLEKTIITNFLVFDKNIDYKGKFINHIQNKTSNQYKFNTSFDNQSNMFITIINLQNEKILGVGKNKKSAEQCASKNALKFINK